MHATYTRYRCVTTIFNRVHRQLKQEKSPVGQNAASFQIRKEHAGCDLAFLHPAVIIAVNEETFRGDTKEEEKNFTKIFGQSQEKPKRTTSIQIDNMPNASN